MNKQYRDALFVLIALARDERAKQACETLFRLVILHKEQSERRVVHLER